MYLDLADTVFRASVLQITDLPGGIAVVQCGFGRIHVFTVQNPDALINAAFECAQNHLGLQLRRAQFPLTREYCREFRLGKARQVDGRIF
ncbi:unnamed protein product, partial [Dicrocoelium dendriticum]